jgi:hypothetical protein
MSKSIWSAAVIVLSVLTLSQEASAGRRHRRSVWYAPSYAPVAVAPQAAAPAMARAPGGANSYRSYSYDPTPVYRAPAAPVYRAQAPSESRFFRADRKAHGLSWYQNQW